MRQTVHSVTTYPDPITREPVASLSLVYESDDGPGVAFDMRIDASGVRITPRVTDADAARALTAGPISFPDLYAAIARKRPDA